MLAEVSVACGSPGEADAISRSLLERRLAACAHASPIRSTYRWRGVVEQADEVRLVITTRTSLVEEVCGVIVAMHGYEVPAITVVHGAPGTAATEQWLREETGEATPQGMQPQHRPE